MSLLVLVPAILAIVALLVIRSSRSSGTGPVLRDDHGLRCQWSGLALGASAAMLTWWLDGPHHYFSFVLAPIVCAGWLSGLVLGERTRGPGDTRGGFSANLERRTAQRYVRARSIWVMRGGFAAVIVLLGAATLGASASSATSFESICDPWTTSAAGPWPGAPYALPGILATAAVWLGCELSIRYVVRRPASGSGGQHDEQARVLGARTALTAAVLAAIPNLGAAAATMGIAMLRACPSPAQKAFAVTLFVAGAGFSLIAGTALLVALGSGGRALVTPVGVARPTAR